jgi:PAS domain S-box-containing protein
MSDRSHLLPEAMLRAIVEQASDGIFVTDTSLRIEWVNDAACAILEQPRDWFIGKLVADLVEPDDLARAPLREGELRAGQPTRTLRRFRTSGGAIRLLEVSAKAMGDGRLLGVARDVTERHALEHSETSFRRLIEAVPDVVMVHRDLRIVYLNPSGVRMFGEHAVGMPVLDLVHPDDRERARRRISSLTEPWSATIPADVCFARRDGESIVLSIAGVRMMFEGVPSIVAIARDVSEQRRMQLQLAQSERMASLGTLAAGVGHEINNPLAYVLLNLQAVARLSREAPTEVGSMIAEHTASAVEGAQRVAQIVRDLRAFSRSDDDIRTVVDVRKPIGIALSTASHELKHRARVTAMLDEAAPVLGSEGKLAQVFLNLLINAAQAIPEGHPSDHEVRVAARCEENEVVVTVSDTGVGIAEEHRQHLFEPFFTTKIDGGSGLGLPICHGLVTALGGTIRVESAGGRGTTFSVILPRAKGEPAVASVKPAAPPSTMRGRILVVDDEPSIAESVSDALVDRHTVVVTTSALEARGILERDSGFDVIVCDVVMPEMTGADLHRWLLEQKPHLAARMLFITGGRDGEAARALRDLEPGRLLEKPFSVEVLEESVDAMMAKRSNRS